MEQKEKVLRAAVLVSKIKSSGNRSHKLRLRYAKKLGDIVDAFIAEEVKEATKIAADDPAHLSWTEVGQALEMSKSKAYRTYGPKSD